MSDQTQRAVLAACLNNDQWAERIWESCTPSYFTGQWHLIAEACQVAWGKHSTNEPYVVQSTLLDIGYARRVSGTIILDLYQEGEPLSDRGVDLLLQRVSEEASRRKVAQIAQQLIAISADQASDFALEVQTHSAALATAVGNVDLRDPMYGTRTLADLFATDFAHDGEVIPGLFRQRTRVVVTGPEGKGKSELNFQIALGLACGMHPFDMTEIPQRRVLVVDAENESSMLKDRLQRIYGQYEHLGGKEPGDNLRLQDALGWNLLVNEDAAHLFSMVRAYQPDLLIIGPVYQIMGGDANDAEVVRRYMRVVDQCRAISGCAVLTEAHAGHGDMGNRNGWRPAGSSLWLRWPDIGIGMSPLSREDGVMQLVRWRGDRLANSWPEQIRRGGLLPWTEYLR